MKKIVLTVLSVILALSCLPVASFATDEIKPTTWAATDGLGRTLSSYDDVGEKKDKFVGLFYWDWHLNNATNTKGQIKTLPPANINNIVAADPTLAHDVSNPIWANYGSHFWQEPLYGYYTEKDDYVLRKQFELIADAGVDAIFFDNTNGTTLYDKDTANALGNVLKVLKQAQEDAVNVPKAAFILNFTEGESVKKKLIKMYEDYYTNDEYKDLFFVWDGKPLVMADPSCLDLNDEEQNEIYNFFTFRINEPGYASGSKGIGTWGWCSTYPQAKFGVWTETYKVVVNGVSLTKAKQHVEQMCVSVAQNWTAERGLSAMNDANYQVFGRGYAVGNYSYSYEKNGQTVTIDKNTEDAYVYGLNFQQQWDYAISQNPEFIFVTGWNEYNMGRYAEWCGTTNAFPDEYNDEYSRDIEPVKGVLKDHFYYQLVENIRRFKGVDEAEYATKTTNAKTTIDINAGTAQWDGIETTCNTYTGSTVKRDSTLFGNVAVQSDTMRNDIVSTKVAYDKDYIYFLVETKDDITSSSDPAWMRLYLDTDSTGNSANWEGFEYIINRVSPEGDEAIVEKSTGGWAFTETGRAKFSVSGKTLQIAVPRSAVGMANTKAPVFNYKWADNTRADGETEDSGDILDFYLYGDVAPGGRFMFTFHGITPGDVNEDGKISSVDYLKIRKTFTGTVELTSAEFAAADFNCDGRILSADYLSVKRVFSGKM